MPEVSCISPIRRSGRTGHARPLHPSAACGLVPLQAVLAVGACSGGPASWTPVPHHECRLRGARQAAAAGARHGRRLPSVEVMRYEHAGGRHRGPFRGCCAGEVRASAGVSGPAVRAGPNGAGPAGAGGPHYRARVAPARPALTSRMAPGGRERGHRGRMEKCRRRCAAPECPGGPVLPDIFCITSANHVAQGAGKGRCVASHFDI
jgi:hypothetical protein